MIVLSCWHVWNGKWKEQQVKSFFIEYLQGFETTTRHRPKSTTTRILTPKRELLDFENQSWGHTSLFSFSERFDFKTILLFLSTIDRIRVRNQLEKVFSIPFPFPKKFNNRFGRCGRFGHAWSPRVLFCFLCGLSLDMVLFAFLLATGGHRWFL